MEEQYLDGFIKEYASTFPEGATPEDVIRHLANNARALDKIRIRNAMMIREFDRLNDGRPIIEIYEDISYKYNVGYTMTRKIISERSLNSF